MDAKSITIIAEYFPGDLSINYTSPYAGAYFSACIEESNLKYSSYTYENLPRLLKALGTGCGLGMVPSSEHVAEELDKEYIAKLSAFLKDFTVAKSEVPGAIMRVSYKAWVFNAPLLIQNLFNYLKGLGVQAHRKKLKSIDEAFDAETKAVFNCTGNGAATLEGVSDKKCYPTRGQVVVVSAPHINECVLLWTDTSTYIIKRPDSALHEVVLGGFYQGGNSDPNTYGDESKNILERTTRLFPKLLTENPLGTTLESLPVIRVVAGIRPTRQCGARIETETRNGGQIIVHNYGAGGEGYLCGLGMSHEAVQLAIS